MKNKIIVIPDVHGRKFWNQIAELDYKSAHKIIFLGDYVDQYPSENITDKECLNNFKEIINFIRNNENVVALLGNHDMHYISDLVLKSTRYNYENSSIYKRLFLNNLDLFKISYYDKDANILFTHAGVTSSWMEKYKLEFTKENIDRDLDNLMKSNISAFNDISVWRGGLDLVGSPIWADIRDFSNTNEIIHNLKQVVGHNRVNNHLIAHSLINFVDNQKIHIFDI